MRALGSPGAAQNRDPCCRRSASPPAHRDPFGRGGDHDVGVGGSLESQLDFAAGEASSGFCSATSPGITITDTPRFPTASRIAISRVRGIWWAPDTSSQ